jgi:hypothetical protein
MHTRVPKPGLRQFLGVMWQEWGSRMCGLTSVPFTVLAVFLQPQYAKITFASLAVVAWFGTVYKVWAIERTRVNQLEESLSDPDVRGQISDVQFSAVKSYIGGELDVVDLTFALQLCNLSPIRTNIIRVVFSVSDTSGKVYRTEASVSRPTDDWRPRHLGTPVPITMKLINVILERGITNEFRGSARFDGLKISDVRQDSLEATAVDSAGEYQLSVVA